MNSMTHIGDESHCSHKVQEKIAITGEAGSLQLLRTKGEGSEPNPLLVIPSVYGLLAYAHSVAEHLAVTWKQVYSVNARGQGASEGEFSLDGAAADIQLVSRFICDSSDGRKVSLYVHCSGMLYFFEIPQTDRFWDSIDRIVLYSYLARPERWLSGFVRKAPQFGIRHVSTEPDLSRYNVSSYARLPVPFGVIHPSTRRSLRLASEDDLLTLQHQASPFAVRRPAEGYKMQDKDQASIVATIVNDHVKPLLRCPLAL